jgi:hypothetical protein
MGNGLLGAVSAVGIVPHDVGDVADQDIDDPKIVVHHQDVGATQVVRNGVWLRRTQGGASRGLRSILIERALTGVLIIEVGVILGIQNPLQDAQFHPAKPIEVFRDAVEHI